MAAVFVGLHFLEKGNKLIVNKSFADSIFLSSILSANIKKEGNYGKKSKKYEENAKG